MPEKVKKNLLGRTVTTSSYGAMGLQTTLKNVTNKKGDVVRSESKISNGSTSSIRRGIGGRKIEKSQSAEGSSRKVTSKFGNTREVRKSTSNSLNSLDGSVNKKSVLENNSIKKEKSTFFGRTGKVAATERKKFSYGKDSVTQKQTMRNKRNTKGKKLSGGAKTTRSVSRTELGGKSGETPVSRSITTDMGPISQAMLYRRQSKK